MKSMSPSHPHLWLLSSFSAALLSCLPFAHGVSELGNGELIIETQTSLEYDSNVNATAIDDKEDFVGTASLGLRFIQEDKSLINLNAGLGLELVRFMDLSHYDSEDLTADFLFSYPNGAERNSYYEFGGDYFDGAQARSEVGDRIDFERLSLNGAYRYYFSEKTGFRVSGDIDEESFGDIALLDSDDVSFQSDFLYRYSSKTNMLLGYRYRDLSFSGSLGDGQEGHTMLIGLDGEISSKVEGHVSIGFQDLTSIDESVSFDQSQFFYDVDLVWSYSEKTQFTLSGTKDFSASPTGEVRNGQELSLFVDSVVTNNATARVGIAVGDYEFLGFQARDESTIDLELGYQHIFTENSILGFLFRTELRDSDDLRFDYDRYRLVANYSFFF